MPARVAGRWDEDDVAGLRQRQTLREGAIGTIREVQQTRRKPTGPAGVEVTVQLSVEALRTGVLGARHEDVDAGEVGKTTGVVGVQVGHHEPAHVALWVYAKRPQLRANLLLRADPLSHGEMKVGMPAGQVARLAGARGLAGIHDEDALRMLNDPCIDGQRLGPPAVEQSVEPADRAGSISAAPALRDGDRPGLDGMNAHVLCFFPHHQYNDVSRMTRY